MNTDPIVDRGKGRRIALGLLIAFYLIAGIGHLVTTDSMVRITPRWVSFPREIVLATGVCELVGVAGLIFARTRRWAGWAFAAYAVCVYPANVQHAIIDLTAGTGAPIWYHAPRLLLQPVIVWWALWATRIVDWPGHARAG